jgi:integrase
MDLMASIRAHKRADGTTTYAVLWRDAESKKQTSMRFATEGEAENFRRILESNGNSLEVAAKITDKQKKGGPTVRSSLEKHVELLTRAGPDQLKRYERAIKNHFGGKFGSLPVASVEHEDVVLWVKGMQDKGLSAKTIANHHGFLSAGMQTAVRLKLREDNPCKGVHLPKDTTVQEKMHFLTAAQAKAIAEAHPERYVALVWFLIGTGCRFGEATALVGSDFELDGPVAQVRVYKAWKRDENNRFYVGQPKTRKSVRTVSLPAALTEKVRPLVEAAPDGLVFTTSYGGPVRHSTFHEFWTDTLDALGYAKTLRPRIHDLRHTHASLMLAAGMSPYELSRRLGHESIQTTIDRYSHLIPDAHFRAAEVAQRALEM